MAEGAFGRTKMKTFLKSFRADKKMGKMIGLELLFIASVAAIVIINGFSLTLISATVPDVSSSADNVVRVLRGDMNITSSVVRDFEIVDAALKSFALKLFIVIGFFALVLTAAAGFIHGKEWSLLVDRKYRKEISIKHALLVLVWNAAWIASFFVILFGLRLDIYTIQKVMLVMFHIYLYLSLFLYPVFYRRRKIMDAVKRTFGLCFMKLYRYFWPFLAAYLMFWAIGLLTIAGISILGPFFLAAGFLLALYYLAWVKVYTNLVVDKDE